MTEMAMKLPLKIATKPNDLVHWCKLFELIFKKMGTREVVLKSTLAPACYRKKKTTQLQEGHLPKVWK